MKKIVSLLAVIMLFSCSSFTDISKKTNVGRDYEGATQIKNSEANFSSLTFGDFKFATDKAQFRKLNRATPKFNDILFYAKTTDVPYEYYVLYNPKKLKKDPGFTYKDTIMASSRFVIAVSKNAPAADANYIKNNVQATVE